MAEYTPIDVELGDFSRSTNNLPVNNTNKLRNRFAKWKNWRRAHPYEEILDQEANRQINSEQWQSETYQENLPNGFEEIELDDIAPNVETSAEVGGEISDTVIDIGESVPLLEGAAGGAAALGTGVAEGASTVGTVVGTTLLGGGAALVGGIVGKVIDNAKKGKGYVLPNSEFIGPGNPIPIGAAKNSADQTAKVHDAGYRDLLENPPKKQKTFHEAVQKLDNEAIESFKKNYEQDGHLNAKVGEVGLSVKRKVEDTLGYPLYPKKPSKFVLYLIVLFLVAGCHEHLVSLLIKDQIGATCTEEKDYMLIESTIRPELAED